MSDFINELLTEVPGEEGPPTPSSSAAGGDGPVETSFVPALAPRLSSPASLARRTVGEAKVKKIHLKRLSQRHKLIIGMHLAGKSYREIATTVGCSTHTIGRIILDPLAQEVIAYYYEGTEEELKALFPKVVEAVRDALDNSNIEVKLKGVDRFAKLTGMGEENRGNKEVNVTVMLDARQKFVNELRAEAEKVVEVEVVEIVE